MFQVFIRYGEGNLHSCVTQPGGSVCLMRSRLSVRHNRDSQITTLDPDDLLHIGYSNNPLNAKQNLPTM